MAEPTLHQRLLDRIAESSDGCEGTSAQPLVDALRVVVERHQQIADYGNDRAPWVCRFDHGMFSFDYPCRTIRAIAEQLGVTVDG